MPKESKGSPRANTKDIYSEIFTVILGSILYGVAVAFFLGPSGTVMGGATGIATTINHFVPQIPIGTFIFIINVPIVLVGLKIYGFKMLWRVVVAVITTSLATNGFELLVRAVDISVTHEPLLCAIMGGAVLGAGGGFMLSRGYNTGGSDLAAVMIHKSLIKSISTGRLIFSLDIVVVVGSALLTKNYAGIIYSIISIYAYSLAVDYIIDGNKTAKMTFIISDKYDDISHAIFTELERGVTILDGQGGYSGAAKHVILCVVKPHELFIVKALVKRVDPKAFMILTDAKEVMGLGFEAIE